MIEHLYLALYSAVYGDMYVYEKTGDVFTLASITPALGKNAAPAFFADGSHAIVHASDPAFMSSLVRSKGVYSKAHDNAITDTGTFVASSPDGMTLLTNSSSGGLLHRRIGDTMTYSQTQSFGNGNGVGAQRFSDDGQYLAFESLYLQPLHVYKINPDTSVGTKITVPDVGQISGAMLFTPGASHLIVGLYFGPFLAVLKRNGDTFTQITVPSLPTSRPLDMALSPDGTHLFMTLANSPRLVIYKIEGDTFTKLANPTALPTNSPVRTIYSPDGAHVAVIQTLQGADPNLRIYKRSGDAYSQIFSAVLEWEASNQKEMAYSPDGQYFAILFQTNIYLAVFGRTGDTYTRLPLTKPPATYVSHIKFVWLKAPTGLSGEVQGTRIVWTWDQILNADGYQIEYGPVGGPYQTSEVGTSATYTQNGISVGVEYEARVRAYEY